MAKNNNNIRFTFGSDPEAFVSTMNNRIKNAIPIVGKDKYNPHNLGGGTKAYFDCCLLETSFKPANSKKELINRLKSVYSKIQNKVLGSKYKMVFKAAHFFPKNELDLDPRSFEVGCTPSFNVHTKSIVAPSNFPSNMRSGAGHIHIGHPLIKNDFGARENLIKLLDVIVGTSLVVINKDKTSSMRRQIYGEAGNFRVCQNYGAEYRSPDSYYLRSPQTTGLVYDLVKYTLKNVVNGNATKMLGKVNLDNVRKAVDKCDKKLSLSILKQVKLPKYLLNRVTKNYGNLDLYREWKISKR